MRKTENRTRSASNEPSWRDLNYMIYETAKKHIPKDLSPREYEDELKRLAAKYNI